MPQLQLKLHCGEEVKQLESGRPVQLAFTVKEMSNELRSAVAQLTFFFFFLYSELSPCNSMCAILIWSKSFHIS